MPDSVEADLMKNERKKVCFDVEEMTNILDGGNKKTVLRRKIVQQIQSDAVLGDMDLTNKSHDQQFISAIKRSVCLRELDLSLTDNEISPYIYKAISRQLLFPVHTGAFIPSIRSLGTKEQAEKWVPLAEEFYIVGSYAQTELGHGTNLRGLETTATFDKDTQEFVINSPNLTSMKWWPGDMGKCSNHVLLMAQLLVGGKNYGMHPFIVQIRDLDTHMPLKGIKVGYIGDKGGTSEVDNGFLHLDHVRIPRENMLARLAEVLPDGSYIKKGNEKVMYSSMMNLRVRLLMTEAILPLQTACTIATRYSVVRTQGSLKQGDPEVPILDYVTQQHKILPFVACCYAFQFASAQTLKMYEEIMIEMKAENFSHLPEIHALSAGLKAYFTEACFEGSETCRRACGGHGYLLSSGFFYFILDQMGIVIVEGDNTVMYLQCAKYLLKCVAQVTTGKLVKGIPSYLNQRPVGKCAARIPSDMGNTVILMKCLSQRANSMIREAAEKMQRFVQTGLSHDEARNKTSVDLVNMVKAHLEFFIMSGFANSVASLSASTKTKEVLSDLCSLYGLHVLNKNPSQLLKTGYINAAQVNMALEEEVAVMSRLRREAVGLVDAFDFTDKSLRSCIGCYDGNAYERLYENAKKAKWNQSEIHQETYEILRPYLHKGRDILQGKKLSKL